MSIMSKIGFACMMLYEGGGVPSSTSGDIVLSVVSLTGAKEKKGITDKGHSFVIIENKTKKNVDVGYYNLKPNEEVSVGLWYGSFFAGPDEFEKIGGVYYNREFYEYNFKYEPEDLVSCKCVIDEQSLWFVSQIIKEKNNEYVLIGYNCSNFATEIWNKVSGAKWETGDYPLYYLEPKDVCANIKANNKYVENPKLKPKGYYYKYANNKLNEVHE